MILNTFSIIFQHVSPKRLGLLALVYYKSGKNYLADSQSTMEQLAVGYFSQFKGLSSILDMIRNKLDLDNAPDWRKLAKKLFKKKAEAVKKKKIGKEENALAESDNEDSGTGKVKQSNGKQEKSTKASGKKQKKQTGAPQQNTAAAVALKSEESSESDATEEEDDDSDAETAPPPTTVDDFFVTADGSNYVSTAVASEKPDDDSDDNSKGHTKQGKGFAKKPHESSFHQKNIKRPVKLATDRLDSGKKRKWTDDNEEESNVGKQLKADSNLHPSWQAKQKLKPTITEFKGTKITFD